MHQIESPFTAQNNMVSYSHFQEPLRLGIGQKVTLHMNLPSEISYSDFTFLENYSSFFLSFFLTFALQMGT